jgi:hypothetical protein
MQKRKSKGLKIDPRETPCFKYPQSENHNHKHVL